MSHPNVPSTTTNITNQYDDNRLQPTDSTSTIGWDELLSELAGGGTFWLTTTDLDGRPHTRPVFAVQADGNVYVSSSRRAAKSTALGANGPTSLAISRPGIDIVWSGTSRPVADGDEVQTVAEAYRTTYGWDVSVDGGALTAPYGAPTAGPPPYDVYSIVPDAVHAIGTDDHFTGRSTRWNIESSAPVTVGSIVVAGHLRIAPGERDSYLESCRYIVDLARRTDGCLDFAISADPVDPDRINIYERWTDRQALDRFRADGPTDDQTAAIVDARVDEFRGVT